MRYLLLFIFATICFFIGHIVTYRIGSRYLDKILSLPEDSEVIES